MAPRGTFYDAHSRLPGLAAIERLIASSMPTWLGLRERIK